MADLEGPPSSATPEAAPPPPPAVPAPPPELPSAMDLDEDPIPLKREQSPPADLSRLLGIIQNAQSSVSKHTQPDEEPKLEIQEDREEKRQKTTDQEDAGPVSWDIGAMLSNALGGLDQTDPEPAPAPASTTATPVIDSPVPPARSPTLPLPISRIKRLPFSQSPIQQTRSMVLPRLAYLSVEILRALSESSTLASIADETSDVKEVYKSLREEFKSARRKLSKTSTILVSEELDIKELGDQETIQMVNMATICSSLLEANDLPLIHIHEHFLTTFLPESNILSDAMAKLFLSLKSRALVVALGDNLDEESLKRWADSLFPEDLGEQLKQLHTDGTLVPSEERFLADAKARKASLLEELRDSEKRKSLREVNFREEVSRYLQDHLDNVYRYAESQGIEVPYEESPLEEFGGGGDLSLNELMATALNGTSGSHTAVKDGAQSSANDASTSMFGGLGLSQLIQDNLPKESPAANEGGLASLIQETLRQSSENGTGAHNIHTGFASHLNQYSQNAHLQGMPGQYAQSSGNIPIPTGQSMPTAQLYENARQVALVKSAHQSRREGLHSTRRPWTPEEEQALMTGLDMVKGPHWSQILSLFGSNGTISDILKDRSQVQLKDKARNLKLFFLKTGTELPTYLKTVTGELKTRAPSQAARKEAEEKARGKDGDEARARFASIQALATLTNPPRNITPGRPQQIQAAQPQPVAPRPTPAPGPGASTHPNPTAPTGQRAYSPAQPGQAPARVPMYPQAQQQPPKANANILSATSAPPQTGMRLADASTLFPRAQAHQAHAAMLAKNGIRPPSTGIPDGLPRPQGVQIQPSQTPQYSQTGQPTRPGQPIPSGLPAVQRPGAPTPQQPTRQGQPIPVTQPAPNPARPVPAGPPATALRGGQLPQQAPQAAHPSRTPTPQGTQPNVVPQPPRPVQNQASPTPPSQPFAAVQAAQAALAAQANKTAAQRAPQPSPPTHGHPAPAQASPSPAPVLPTAVRPMPASTGSSAASTPAPVAVQQQKPQPQPPAAAPATNGNTDANQFDDALLIAALQAAT